ncbi:FAD-dependent oxidoreductase [Deinococcus aerophilus]|uniref:FAD dependent oxidoreductase domain-containing protein n=1 Tax=Deinococcus aerophilus TaxID=522488 RepID=A0ABQ2GZK4_9DEIO|nr:FAD-dependent oxidoreductase [Deinococcus aerophilus]GGM21211.1 hypothetical protein GCM10010841_31430 [Deinococcus aerophilus]
MNASPSPAGQVWAHVGQRFTPQNHDVVVVGAGRMGSACALYVRQLAPHLRVLLLEEGGLPNEDGATLLAPGVWSAREPSGERLEGERLEQARWTRRQLETAFGDVSFAPRPLIRLFAEAGPDRSPTADALAPWPDARAMVNAPALPFAEVEQDAATYRPGAVALAAARAAVAAGADLMLNARARPVPGGVVVERLTVTNTHQIVTHETHTLHAGVTILALGADGPSAAEHELGLHTAHARAYRQVPRLNVPSDDTTPILHAGGLTLRPQHGGFTLIPSIHHRDPHGYAPTGGRLTGVPTGLRRETLEDLVGLMDALPPLGTGALELGRSVSDVPGVWLALPGGRPGGLPQHQRLQDGVHLLLGGPQADTLGLAVAYDLAATVAEVRKRPWEKSGF